MKNSGFKMKGYTYPGTSPMKGKAQMKRDAGRAKADDAQDTCAMRRTFVRPQYQEVSYIWVFDNMDIWFYTTSGALRPGPGCF